MKLLKKTSLISFLLIVSLVYDTMAQQNPANTKTPARKTATKTAAKPKSDTAPKVKDDPNKPPLPRQCIAKGKDGKRCPRTTLDKSGKCWQHNMVK